MSEMAKAARAAMKNKAKRLGTTDPSKKVDASSWSPPEPLNTEAKTGLRPLSRRAYKKGGKVEGAVAKMHAGRKPRKSGGEASMYANAKINRNVKDANEEREGIKHVGGMMKGGRACKQAGGSNPPVPMRRPTQAEIDRLVEMQRSADIERGLKRVQRDLPAFSGVPASQAEKEGLRASEANRELRRTQQNTAPVTGTSPTAAEKEGLSRMKKGGRTKKEHGGPSGSGYEYMSMHTTPGKADEYMTRQYANEREPNIMSKANRKAYEDIKKFKEDNKQIDLKRGGRTKKAIGGAFGQYLSPALMLMNALRGDKDEKKSGGRIKKQMGGMLPGDPRLDIVKRQAMNFQGNPVTPGAKKGGKIERHPDEAMDKALIKQMVKKEARTGKAHGGMQRINRADGGGASLFDAARRGKYNGPKESMNDTENAYRETLEGIDHLRAAEDQESYRGKKSGGVAKRMNRKSGGMALDGEIQGTRPTGGRMARKDGGRAKGKGKTDINIIISAGPKAGPGIPPGMMPPAGPPNMPPMNPQAVGAAVPVMTSPPPGPMPAPGPMPGPAMPPGMGMPRKSGGRITPKAKSFADMKAGAGSGEGRLQKTDIAEYKRGRHRAGGKVYRSYEDMDAGAGSGLGRLEKTEVQSRKR